MRHAANSAATLMAMCSHRNASASPAPSSTPATSGPAAENAVCSAATVPRVWPTMPRGASDAVSGLSTGLYIVSPTAKMPYVVMNTAAAMPGVKCATDSSSHENTQMPDTIISRLAALRFAVSFTTATCSSTITMQLTAAAVPIADGSTASTVIAYAGSPDSNCA